MPDVLAFRFKKLGLLLGGVVGVGVGGWVVKGHQK